MARMFDQIIKKAWLAMGVGCIALLLSMQSVWADPWTAPVMTDYLKQPSFTSYRVSPNIMIVLDNSGSMNRMAYSDVYTGEPYDAWPVSYYLVGDSGIPLSLDDMEESPATGVVRDNDGDGLDLGTDYVGIRFQDLPISQGAIIDQAYIQFTANGDSTGLSDLVIRIEDSADASPMDDMAANNISGRTYLTDNVSWSPSAWTDGQTYNSQDVTDLVQAIVNRADWDELSNNILFSISGSGFPTTTGQRTAHSRESSETTGPVLRILVRDQPAKRYYGYYNPDYFYEVSGGVFKAKFKKISYDYNAQNWRVETLSGTETTIDDSDIAPASASAGLWDGNFANWSAMRRIDVMRKVLVGGQATNRDGSGEDILVGEAPTMSAYDGGKTFDTSGGGPAVTPYDGNYHYYIWFPGELWVRDMNTFTWITGYDIEVKTSFATEPDDFYLGQPGGVLQRIGNRARWGNMWFNQGFSPNNGGFVDNTIETNQVDSLVSSLESTACWTMTPLAETFYVAIQHFRQQVVASGLGIPPGAAKVSPAEDPYYDDTQSEYINCAKSFVLLLTDGQSTADGSIPDTIGTVPVKDFDGDGEDACVGDCSSDYLDDLALYAHTTDLRPALDGDQDITFYTVYAFDNNPVARELLQNAARNGAFKDQDGDNRPDGLLTETDPALRLEWDQDGDGIPDTYYEASDGAVLKDKLIAAFNSILARASSGTAASVVANSRTGEGALYQSIFYPSTTIGDDTVNWVGQLQALMVDEYGNMREDTNGNHKLDVNLNDTEEDYLGNDLVILFTDDTVNPVKKYQVPAYYNKRLDITDGLATLVHAGDILDIEHLWTSSEWLNEITDADITAQRAYTHTSEKRHIFTFVDGDGNMVADTATEVFDFVAAADPDGPAWADAIDDTNYWAYLHPYEPFSPPVGAAHTDFRAMVRRQLQRTVNFVRGQDQPMESVGSAPLTLPSYRSRVIDYDEDGIEETWRMGDIVFSTPTVVGKPAENYDLIWRDESYRDFYIKYRGRRNMIYVGANDGMLHAFNGGFFDSHQHEFLTQPYLNDGITPDTSYHDFALGQEMWAYIPFNLLPHLHWLTDPEYGHVYYCDLQPRIFDAKIFPDDGVHPNGWGTVMVAGMRFGGGRIAADIDKEDGAYDVAVDKSMSSAYFIFDITDPENPPVLLAEITLPRLGFTTCHPGVIPMRDLEEIEGQIFPQSNQNLWYLLFGSGPIDTGGAFTTALLEGTSSQQGVMYAIDLVKLVQDKKVVTLTPTGEKTVGLDAQPFYWVQFPEADSFVSKPIAVDRDLDFNTEVVYFGTAFQDSGNGLWGGKLRRIVPDELHWSTPWEWTTDNVMIDLTDIDPGTPGNQGQPVTAPPTTTIDGLNNRWVYFGTGRYFSTTDASNTQQQSYYGIKEPYTEVSGERTFSFTGTLTTDALLNVSNFNVHEHGAFVENYTGGVGTSFADLELDIENNHSGWVTDFSIDAQRERNLGQAVLAGEILTFTTYMPALDSCDIGGRSMVYALYYRTGTAYWESIFGTETSGPDTLVLKTADLGDGMTITPNIHVGQGEGSQAYIQTSDGSIKTLAEDNPGEVKSKELHWAPDTDCQ